MSRQDMGVCFPERSAIWTFISLINKQYPVDICRLFELIFVLIFVRNLSAVSFFLAKTSRCAYPLFDTHFYAAIFHVFWLSNLPLIFLISLVKFKLEELISDRPFKFISVLTHCWKVVRQLVLMCGRKRETFSGINTLLTHFRRIYRFLIANFIDKRWLDHSVIW